VLDLANLSVNLKNVRDKFIVSSILFMIFASIFSLPSTAFSQHYTSNRFSRPDILPSATIKQIRDVMGHTRILENEYLEIWQRDSDLSIRIVDKKTGYVWGTVDTSKANEFNQTWSGIASSIVAIEVFDKGGILKAVGSGATDVLKEYKKNGNSITYKVSFQSVGITLTFKMSLAGNHLTFELLPDSIVEGSEYSLATVMFMPFLGAVREKEVDGYVFIPDGNGALMRFSNAAHYLAPYERKVYGKDGGIDDMFEVNDLKAKRPNDFAVEPPQILIPALGIVHAENANGFLITAKSGAEFSSVVTYPSGIISKYTWGTIKFIYRQKYTQRTSRSGAGIQVPQKDKNVFNAKAEYTFFNGNDASYIGFANYLKGNYTTGKNEITVVGDKDVPVMLYFILSDIEKGILSYNVKNVTTVDAIIDYVKQLKSAGVNNIILFIDGWQKGGKSGYKVSEYGFEDKVFNAEQRKKLFEFSRAENIKLYFVDAFKKVTERQLNLRAYEVGINLSQAPILEEKDDKTILFNKTYYFNAYLAIEKLTQKIPFYKNNSIENVALADFASTLYSDNRYDNSYPRDYIKNQSMKALQKLQTSLNFVAMKAPHDYAWQYADAIYDVPVNNGQYLFLTDTVPFLQIILKGSVPYFAPPMNLSFYSREDVLKCIEYGAYPSFTLTELNNFELKDTGISDIYSSQFYDWKQEIIDIYKEINSALSRFLGQKIVDRRTLQEGFVVVKYENGDYLCVNYTESEKEFENNKIAPLSWKIVEVRK